MIEKPMAADLRGAELKHGFGALPRDTRLCRVCAAPGILKPQDACQPSEVSNWRRGRERGRRSEDSAPKRARKRARDGLHSTQNQPTPANSTKETPRQIGDLPRGSDEGYGLITQRCQWAPKESHPGAQAQRALGATLDLIVQEGGEELDERGLLFHGLAVAELQGLQNPGQPQRAEHRRKLMGQLADLLSSAPGSGKKVVQGWAWRGPTAGAAGAGGGSAGSGW